MSHLQIPVLRVGMWRIGTVCFLPLIVYEEKCMHTYNEMWEVYQGIRLRNIVRDMVFNATFNNGLRNKTTYILVARDTKYGFLGVSELLSK